ncbi:MULTISPECIES: hypothetical protein [Actinomycetes]|uniref:Uncharacterized protein n=2 Tax=Actinomycetes TaxID=1760 RepID=A0A967AZ66_9MICO|nr:MULTISPECIES: hypothetical protein [Actinomycetes]NOP36728.1 hypothetical protein [Calidifontibacter sp. DB2511S]NHN54433.1 hypothetical protein [Metallococcus carri]NYI72298.1 hypothetical protein [Naumannella cuiyingiana]OYO05747.1 hypothetical protein CGZ97_03340 [Enemella evansiae]UZF58466.1 hypothetical protein LH935_11095 [Gordonia polyisoprenivorans]
MQRFLSIARRFSPVLAVLTVAALLMLQPPARAADHFSMSASLGTVAAGAGAAEMATGHSPANSAPIVVHGQFSTKNVGDQQAAAAADPLSMGTVSSGMGMASGCGADCGSPASPSPGPMDCVAAGCLILLVLLVGIGSLRPAARGGGWSLPRPARRTLIESLVLRCWARPPLSLAELSISRT